MDRMIQMMLNRVLRLFMNKAIDGGISYVARRGKSPGEMTDSEREQARAGKDLAKRARKMSRASRRLF